MWKCLHVITDPIALLAVSASLVWPRQIHPWAERGGAGRGGAKFTWLLKKVELVTMKTWKSSCGVNKSLSLYSVYCSTSTVYHNGCWGRFTVAIGNQSAIITLVRYHVIVVSIQHLRCRCLVTTQFNCNLYKFIHRVWKERCHFIFDYNSRIFISIL